MVKILHVVFGYSAAGSLRRAIENAKRDDEVIAQLDGFELGPIAPPNPALRAKWLCDELGWSWLDELDSPELDLRRDDAFWQRIIRHEGRLVVWVSRRSAGEYAGFLALVWQLSGKSCDVVDVTDYIQPGFTNRDGHYVAPQLVGTVNLLVPPLFFRNETFGQAYTLSPAQISKYHAAWETLRVENAPLRVLESGRLVSASLNYFDEFIRTFVTENWQRGARIAGNVLAAQWDRQEYQFSDMFCWSRLLHLAETGRIEARGDLASMRTTELRCPV
jgi:hypothetical protein